LKAEHRIRPTPLTPLVIAVDLSRDAVVGALVDERARVLAERRVELAQPSVRAAGAAVTGMLLELSALPERRSGEVRAVGLSVPGLVEPRAARVSATSLDWRRVALAPAIERGLVESGVDIRPPASARHSKAARSDAGHPPVVIAPLRAAHVAAEAWVGAARGRQNVVCLLVGREIRAGVMADGRIVHGGGGLAGSVGWFALGENFRPEYARVGCLTAEANDAAFLRRTVESWTSGEDSTLGLLASSDPSGLTPATVIRAAASGDSLALRVVGEACRWIGRAVADLISLLNPEVVVIGGRLGAELKPYLGDIRREARQWAQPEAARQCRVVGARLPRAALLGAARLAWLRAGAQTGG
jgi:glucokinase